MRWLLVAALLLGGPIGARADTDRSTIDTSSDTIPLVDHSTARTLRVPIIVVENLGMLLVPGIYYWWTPDLQKEDWALHWDWPSWKSKLTSLDPLVLDTNKFEANAIRHPMVGAVTYQIGRANGMSPLASTIMAFGTSMFWEYVIEFKEQPSANDIVSNTVSGLLIGEPLFQIALLADSRPTTARRALALGVAPFHRVQKEVGLSPILDTLEMPNRLEVLVGGHTMQQTGNKAALGELRFGLDLETMREHAFGLPGDDTRWTGPGTWNRVAFDLTLGGSNGTAISGGRFRSSTTYAGLLERDIDRDGLGRTTFVGVGGGVDIVDRRLPSEWDKYTTFQLVKPRAGVWWRTPFGDLDLEAGGSGDVAMVQAHALANDPPIPGSSIVLSRGYYYATGISAEARARVRRGRWSGELEGVAHKFWSFDEHDHGGNSDPRDLTDARIVNTASIGVKPTDRDLRVVLYGSYTVRRGTGDDLWRETEESILGLAVTAGF